MELFENGKLSPRGFDADIRHGTRDLSTVLSAAADSGSNAIESTHFLMALAGIVNGVTHSGIIARGLTVQQWRDGLLQSVASGPHRAPPTELRPSDFHDTTVAMLDAACKCCDQQERSAISEPILLRCALENATSEVSELCELARIDLKRWLDELDHLIHPKIIPVFDENGMVNLRAGFSPSGKRVLRLMLSEAESLGFAAVDTRHLLLALLENESGATHYGLHRQGVSPAKLHEAVILNLRLRAKSQRTNLQLRKEHLQTLPQQILIRSGEIAGQEWADQIAEPHLLRAFLSVESAALRLLADQNIDVAALEQSAAGFDIAPEEGDEESVFADIETVRRRIQERLVGQDQIIDQILPYVELMRLDFRTPGRPVGVFLFCGQSGSGKTEMAKELARAVYGTEENLIFLEMGQFNSPESMNIFVGAPPAFVGYGQGKLTNGLRDKPRSVVLFDEVEKAHRKVLDALLRFLDEGKVDDPAGPVRDGSQCIVVLTSNEAAEEVASLQTEVEDNPNRRTVLRKRLREILAKRDFRVEFLNRVDEVLLFHSLTRNEYSEIANRQLRQTRERFWEQRQIRVEPDPSVVRMIGTYCAEIDEGARAVPRLLKSIVILPICRFVLQNQCAFPVTVKVYAERTSAEPDCEPTGIVELAD